MKRLGIPWWSSGQDSMLPGSGSLGSVPDWGTRIPRKSESESCSVVFNSLSPQQSQKANRKQNMKRLEGCILPRMLKQRFSDRSLRGKLYQSFLKIVLDTYKCCNNSYPELELINADILL